MIGSAEDWIKARALSVRELDTAHLHFVQQLAEAADWTAQQCMELALLACVKTSVCLTLCSSETTLKFLHSPLPNEWKQIKCVELYQIAVEDEIMLGALKQIRQVSLNECEIRVPDLMILASGTTEILLTNECWHPALSEPVRVPLLPQMDLDTHLFHPVIVEEKVSHDYSIFEVSPTFPWEVIANLEGVIVLSNLISPKQVLPDLGCFNLILMSDGDDDEAAYATVEFQSAPELLRLVSYGVNLTFPGVYTLRELRLNDCFFPTCLLSETLPFLEKLYAIHVDVDKLVVTNMLHLVLFELVHSNEQQIALVLTDNPVLKHVTLSTGVTPMRMGNNPCVSVVLIECEAEETQRSAEHSATFRILSLQQDDCNPVSAQGPLPKIIDHQDRTQSWWSDARHPARRLQQLRLSES